MKDTITKTKFVEGFEKIRPNQFSMLGLEALFDYLEELEEDIGQELEFDPIAFSGEWDEYKDIEDFFSENPDHEDEKDRIEEPEDIADYLGLRVIEHPDGFLVSSD